MASNILIIHGSGISGISQKISLIKKGFDGFSITEISSKNQNLEQALISASTSQLFSEKRLVILEDFDPSVYAGQGVLEKLPDDPGLTLILKFSKKIPAASPLLKQAPKLNAQVILFEEKDEQSVFPFLDSLAEKQKKSFGMFENLYEEYGGQYLLTMIYYMLRRLLMEPKKNLPGFVIQKIDRQKRNFPLEKVKELYKFALETDFKMKSGLLEERMGLTLVVNKVLSV